MKIVLEGVLGSPEVEDFGCSMIGELGNAEDNYVSMEVDEVGLDFDLQPFFVRPHSSDPEDKKHQL